MKWFFEKLNSMNGWKAVIAVIGMVGTSWLSIHDQLQTNHAELAAFIAAQAVHDKALADSLDMYRNFTMDRMNRLEDKIDGIKSARTK